jgi:NTE family protein
MSVRIWAFCLFLSVLLASPIAVPQAVAPGARHPKVGLVREGGAALGLAHIGVLQWLEEHRIPVSYVAGTSIGGLVGNLRYRALSRRDPETGDGNRLG